MNLQLAYTGADAITPGAYLAIIRFSPGAEVPMLVYRDKREWYTDTGHSLPWNHEIVSLWLLPREFPRAGGSDAGGYRLLGLDETEEE